MASVKSGDRSFTGDTTRMRYLRLVVSMLPLVLAVGCSKPELGTGLPSVSLATSLPEFTSQQNEVEISDLMGGNDPTVILGSIVNTKSGLVHSIDNFLVADAKPTVTLISEVLFRNLVESSSIAKAEYLAFAKAGLSDSMRAEVSMVKSARATVKSSDLNRTKLVNEFKTMSADKRGELGVIIGYVDFVLSATYFSEQKIDAAVSGYGAKIDNKWFNKIDNNRASHRVVAVWAPLPFVLDQVVKPRTDIVDMTQLASQAMKGGDLKNLQSIPTLKLKELLQIKK